MKRRLTVGNVGTALAEYSEEIASVGGKIQGKLGLKLLHEVKREPTGTGPFRHSTHGGTSKAPQPVPAAYSAFHDRVAAAYPQCRK